MRPLSYQESRRELEACLVIALLNPHGEVSYGGRIYKLLELLNAREQSINTRLATFYANRTILSLAAGDGNSKSARLIINHFNPDFNLRDDIAGESYTPLMRAVLCRARSKEITDIILHLAESQRINLDFSLGCEDEEKNYLYYNYILSCAAEKSYSRVVSSILNQGRFKINIEALLVKPLNWTIENRAMQMVDDVVWIKKLEISLTGKAHSLAETANLPHDSDLLSFVTPIFNKIIYYFIENPSERVRVTTLLRNFSDRTEAINIPVLTEIENSWMRNILRDDFFPTLLLPFGAYYNTSRTQLPAEIPPPKRQRIEVAEERKEEKIIERQESSSGSEDIESEYEYVEEEEEQQYEEEIDIEGDKPSPSVQSLASQPLNSYYQASSRSTSK